MGGAGFLLVVNFALAACFAIGFFAISRFDPARPAPRWFALGFVFGMVYSAGEGVLALGSAPLASHMVSSVAFVLVLCCMVAGIAEHYGARFDRRWLVAIALLSVPLYLGLFFLPREMLARQIAHQAPYALLQGIATVIAWRAARRAGWLDRALAAILVLYTASTASKPVIAALTGGIGARPEDYVQGLYATISQTTGGVLSIAVGVFAMLILVRDIAAAMAARAEQDSETGFFTLRGFESRLAIAMEGRAGAQAVMMVEIAGRDESGALPQDAVAALRAALSANTPPWAVRARIGADRYAVFDPAANVLSARRAMQRVLDAARHPDAVIAIGIAETEEDDVPQVVTRRCEGALMRAWQAGGNCVRIAPRSHIAIPERNVG